MNHNTLKPLTLKRWVWFTALGWLTGFACTMLIIFLFEALHIGNQSMIGIGMGAGVGLIQALLLKRYQLSGKHWFWSTFIGMSVPYLLYDLVSLFISMRPETILPIATALGGLLAGTLQYYTVLKPHPGSSRYWILLTAVGWLLAHGFLLFLFANEKLKQLEVPVILILVFAISCILSGGPILGLITGKSMVKVVQQQTLNTPE